MGSRLARFLFRKKFAALLLILLLVVVTFGERVLWTARQAIREGAQAAAAAGHVPVRFATVRTNNSHFESFLIPAEFRSAAMFHGELFLAGGSALFRYDAGELKQIWHVGRELPPFPLESLCVRSAGGSPELWIATGGGGVLVYDGTAFHQMLPEAAAVRKITAMLPLRNGRVMVGTRNAGLYSSDGKSFTLFHSQFAHSEITALAGDGDLLWIGTRADGAWLWRGGEALHVINDLPDAQVLALASRGESAWIGTALGVTEFAGGKMTRHLADGVFAQALAERDGLLWIGTVDQGTIALPLAEHRPRPRSANVSDADQNVASLLETDGHLLAVRSGQVAELPDHTVIASAPATTLRSGHITALHRDGRGRLWIGYFDRGLEIVDLAGRLQTQHFEDDVVFCVNRIKGSADSETTAVATANGLALFDGSAKLRQVLDSKSGLIASHVTDVLFEPQDTGLESMIVATPAGLSFVEGGSVSSLYAFQGLVNNHVYTLVENGPRLYAGTLGGVTAIRRGLVEASFSTANSQLRQNWITASALFDGKLYLGTYGSGVVGFGSDGSVESFREFARARCEINPNAMLATGRALYAGTAGQGLAMLRRGDQRWQLVENGLPSANVTALSEQGGELSIGTDNGLVRIAERDLVAQ